MEPDASVYRKILPVDGQTNIELEILTHRYTWESNRSPAISLTDALVPSKSFSEAFNLKAMANSFDQVTNKGTLASITLDPPCGFEGQLLYLREDLLLEYANGRNLIWVVYRERQIYPHPFPRTRLVPSRTPATSRLLEYCSQAQQCCLTLLISVSTWNWGNLLRSSHD